jgi:hypothetical protein
VLLCKYNNSTEGNVQDLKKLKNNTVYVLQLQGTGDDEYAYENAGVYTSTELAVAVLADINAEYTEADDFVFTLNENARIETHTLNT